MFEFLDAICRPKFTSLIKDVYLTIPCLSITQKPGQQPGILLKSLFTYLLDQGFIERTKGGNMFKITDNGIEHCYELV